MRPSDWSALNLGSDPTPGDPEVVRSGGQHYVRVADSIARAAATLRALDAGDSQAESVKALLEQRDVLTDKVVTAEGRYRATGQALVTYSSTLDRVQTETYQALLRAQQAASDAADAEQLAAHYGEQADNVDPDAADDGPDYASKESQQRAAANAARARISAEVSKVNQAVEERDQAAETAIQAIHDITDRDGLKDSWWDNWGAKVTEWIAKVAEAVSTIAGILALVVCWIPVIGQALAGVLLIVAAVAGIVAALANIALAATGKKSWTEAIISIAMAAAGCIGLRGALSSVRAVGGLRGLARGGRAAAAAESAVNAVDDVAKNVLNLRPKANWSTSQLRDFHRKVDALNELAARGELSKVINPEQRLPGLRKFFMREWGLPPNSIKGFDIDHIHELQLGGTNDLSNLWTLDSSVNRSVGAQIKNQLRNFEFGDVIHQFDITP